ncbi:ion channel [Flavicella marina]|uniref:ion channel n=1 Tax=Flavicella marina TaxID=1475951 RepID=UPI001263E769|nr:ion channel [Flavicella marina]
MARKIKDPGLGYSSDKNVQSFINPDGSPNILHLNRERNFDDLYTYLLSLSWVSFLSLVTLGFILLNTFFAFIYLWIGIEHLSSLPVGFWGDFVNAFNFSAQTITTVGYGSISPTSLLSGIVSSIEALIGLMSFSFITGLLYGRFSKPKPSVRFSRTFLVRKFEEDRALMFRLSSKRTTIMIEPEIKVTLTISESDKSGEFKRSFYQLKLEREKITYLPTMWTLVHKIDHTSPLYKYSDEELQQLKANLYILFQYHEDSFAQKVYKLHSYQFEDLQTNVQFKSSVKFSEEGQIVLDHNLLNQTEPLV